ncbi:MAG: AzlD domain-containing protein [Gemmobacter sp.]
MTQDTLTIWTVIIATGVGTYLIRLSFLGVVGGRPLPPVVLRLLRYTPVAVLPGIVLPLVLWPAATGGETDLPRLLAALATLAIGVGLRNVLLSIFGGAFVLYGAGWLLG